MEENVNILLEIKNKIHQFVIKPHI